MTTREYLLMALGALKAMKANETLIAELELFLKKP